MYFNMNIGIGHNETNLSAKVYSVKISNFNI